MLQQFHLTFFSLRPRGLILSAMLLMAACTTTVPVEYNFPSAAIQPLPITIGVHYSEALVNYNYLEASGDDDWDVEIGSASKALFERVLTDMFVRTIVVDGTSASGVDAIIVPELQKFEISTPADSELEFYEAWIQYNFTLYAANGTRIGTWKVTGYGRDDDSAFMGTRSDVAGATLRAMRDAAAALIIGFRKEPAINDWLNERVPTSRARVQGGFSSETG